MEEGKEARRRERMKESRGEKRKGKKEEGKGEEKKGKERRRRNEKRGDNVDAARVLRHLSTGVPTINQKVNEKMSHS